MSIAVAAEPAWRMLFNRDAFHALNLHPGQSVLHASVDDSTGRTIGALTGVVTDDVFVSGHSAPFGGVDLARDRETPANVAALVDGALAQLRVAGVRTARVRLPPACLGDSEGLIAFTLLNRGFSVARCELNQHVALARFVGSPGAYIAALKSPARRALRSVVDDPAFTFTHAEPDDDTAWHRGYATLAANRAARGRALSLSRDGVDAVRAAFPGEVAMGELLHDGRAVAAALTYRVRPGRALVVAWGDANHALPHSPMNLLAYRVVETALSDGARVLDLGVSTERDADPHGALPVNAGLAQFKQSVLAASEPRLTLVKDLT